MIINIIDNFFDRTAPRGFSTIIVSILFLGRLNLIGLRIIGEYVVSVNFSGVGRIYKEAKKD